MGNAERLGATNLAATPMITAPSRPLRRKGLVCFGVTPKSQSREKRGKPEQWPTAPPVSYTARNRLILEGDL